MLKINLIVIAFYISIVASCGLDESKTNTVIYHTIIDGQVLNKITEKPIDSAKVYLWRSPGLYNFLGSKIELTVFTDNEGKFYIDNSCTIDDRYGCHFTLGIYKDSYQSVTSFTDIESGAENKITIYLTPYSSYHTIINGLVLDATTGSPIENAVVELKKSGRYPGSDPSTILSVYTNDEGRFYIDNNCTEDLFYKCDLSLEINKNSYQLITSFTDIEEGKENDITIYLTPT